MSANLIADLLGSLDPILGIRDAIGAALKPVYIVTRAWSGSAIGDGSYTEVKTQMLPSPKIVDYSQSVKIQSGGFYEQGDIVLKYISKNAYPTKSDIDCSLSNIKKEKFYLVGTDYYRVISITEDYLTWSVQLRRIPLVSAEVFVNRILLTENNHAILQENGKKIYL